MTDSKHSTDWENLLEQAASVLANASKVTVLTGAGVSAESGIPTFRGSDGLWEGHSLDDVATPRGFHRDPVLVWKFYNHRRAKVREAGPNPGHVALAKMEERWGAEQFTIVTQNIDGLHQRAGSTNVLEVHGSLATIRCVRCAHEENHLDELPALPSCPTCGHHLRPAVVWFGETLPEDIWTRSLASLKGTECVMVVGTSAVVYPAAGLIDRVHRQGIPVIEINLEPTAANRGETIGLYAPSGVILPRLLTILEQRS